MKSMNKWLGIIAVAQGALVLVVWLASQPTKAVSTSLLNDLEWSSVTAVEITENPGGEEANTLRLEKAGNDWVVATQQNFPADDSKVRDLVDSLAVKVTTPISSRKSHHQKLGVAKKGAERKVVLKQGEKATTLWLGPGARAGAHVRVEGDERVYRVRNLKVWDLKADGGTYFDKQVIDVNPETLQEVWVTNSSGSLHLKKEADQWVVLDVSSELPLDGAKVSSLLRGLSKVSMTELARQEVQEDFGLDGRTAVTLTTAEGNQVKYLVGLEKDGSHYFQEKGSAFVVMTTPFATEQARTILLDDLLQIEAPVQEPAAVQ